MLRFVSALLVVGLCTGCSPPEMASRPATTAASFAGGIDHGTGTFAASSGNITLFEQWWKVAAAPPASSSSGGASRTTLVIVHGLKDHSSRYAAFADRLAKDGIAVYAFDLRGHAHSSGLRVGIDSFDDYVNDLDVFVKRVRDREPNTRLFVMGHSMGAAIATMWTMKKQPHLAGLITSGGALTVRLCPLKIGGTKATAAIAPNAGVFNLDLDDFSRDPNTIKEGKADPLIYQDGAPARTAKELLHAIDVIEHNAGAINVPLLALHGEADKITPPEGSKHLVENALSSDKTLKLYPNLAHDLLHEPEKEAVTKDIEDWIKAHAR